MTHPRLVSLSRAEVRKGGEEASPKNVVFRTDSESLAVGSFEGVDEKVGTMVYLEDLSSSYMCFRLSIYDGFYRGMASSR